MKKISALFIGLVAGLLSYQSMAQRVIAYQAAWEDFIPNSTQLTKVTDVNFSFIVPNADGSIPAWQAWELPRFNAFKAYPSTVKKLISVGGDGTEARMSSVIGNSTTRAALATNLANYVQTHGLDGVDLDWEYPRASESSAFLAFIQDLRTKLDAKEGAMGKQLEITIAVFATAAYGTEGITKSIIDAVDLVNIMAYDNNQETNHSALSWATGSTVVNFWLNTKQVPKNKLVLGLPFYGRPSFSPTNSNSQNIRRFWEITNTSGDSEAGYYYNGTVTIEAKTKYAVDNGLAGVMFWEFSQDRKSGTMLLDAIKAGIAAGGGCVGPSFTNAVESLCGKSSITLDCNLGAPQTGYTFSWKRNGNTVSGSSHTLNATTGGVYVVTATKGACIKTAQVEITSTFPALDLGSDQPICNGQTVTLTSPISAPAGATYTYQWKNGSTIIGTAKTQDVTAAGTYTLTISDPQSKCASVTDNVGLSSEGLTLKTDTACNPSGSVTLNVLSQGGPYSWFDQQTGGNLLNVGSAYTTDITANKTFWVQNAGGSINKNFGWVYDPTKIDPTKTWQGPGVGDYGDEIRLVFDAQTPMTLDSVTVHYDGAWSGPDDAAVFTVYSSSGAVVSTKTHANAIKANGRIRLPIGITVQPGTGYMLGMKATPKTTGQWSSNFWSEKRPWAAAGANDFAYPFTVDGVVSIKHTVAKSESNFGAAIKNWYAGFYDIRVSAGAPCPRKSVTAVILACAAPTISLTAPANNTTVKVGEIVNFAVNAKATSSVKNATIAKIEYKVMRGTTVVSTSTTPNWTANETTGAYTVTATITDSEGQITTSSPITINVVVNGTEEETVLKDGLTVYPNPFASSFTLKMDGNVSGKVTILLYDAAGRLVSNQTTTNREISVGSELPSGIYNIQVVSETGVVTGRITKQ